MGWGAAPGGILPVRDNEALARLFKYLKIVIGLDGGRYNTDRETVAGVPLLNDFGLGRGGGGWGWCWPRRANALILDRVKELLKQFTGKPVIYF